MNIDKKSYNRAIEDAVMTIGDRINDTIGARVGGEPEGFSPSSVWQVFALNCAVTAILKLKLV